MYESPYRIVGQVCSELCALEQMSAVGVVEGGGKGEVFIHIQ